MSGTWVLLSWILCVLLGYGALGGYFGRLVEGYDSTANSALPALVTLAGIALSLGLTLGWARKKNAESRASNRPGRRFFLLGALGAGGGIMATGLAAFARVSDWYAVSGKHIFLVRPPYKADQPMAEWSGSLVRDYRRLGRTEALISDISLGSGSGTGGRQTAEVANQADA